MGRRVPVKDMVLILLGAGITFIIMTSPKFESTKYWPSGVDMGETSGSQTSHPHEEQNVLELNVPVHVQVHSPKHPKHPKHPPVNSDNTSPPSTWPLQYMQPMSPKHQHPFNSIPCTKLLHAAPGWTLWDDIYMADDSFYVVLPTEKDVIQASKKFPELKLMISRPLFALNEPQNIADRMPISGQTLKYISKYTAESLWGSNAESVLVVEGNTLMVNEVGQFLGHYYHLIAELFLGAWVFWTGAHADGKDIVSPPPLHRIIFGRAPATWNNIPQNEAWHDNPGMNAFIMHGVFPSMSFEDEQDWNDRVAITKDAERVYRFPKMLLADRHAAHRGDWSNKFQRSASEAWSYVRERALFSKRALEEGAWWAPFRESVWRLVGVRNFHVWTPEKPLTLTYWSRQVSRTRKLKSEDDEILVKEIEDLASQKGWTFNHIRGEKISKDEQLRIASSTDILFGVHGNGLSHLCFMPHSKISTVIEIFYPNAVAHDYQWTSYALGHGYAGIWNDTYWTHHPHRWPNYPEGEDGDGGFQGDNIPVHGPFVRELIEKIVDGTVDLRPKM